MARSDATAPMTAVDSVPLSATQGPDRLTVQFPTRVTDDTERPYFLGRRPQTPGVRLALDERPDQLEVGRLTGLGSFTRWRRPAK